eukprot:CAMPEP_0178405964 /NCGR_PEP_ID=MMETSP0689_2-20121128/18670_1 /TAXON_ID=160604 /ORGANISM="Amphidinium massartii, Strain CS-259" /LENGTH=416 /DNA_ID=CAMNT_0020026995 /DNA_START=11 /DNA_END=1261 /DNA_ORIENTATION=-
MPKDVEARIRALPGNDVCSDCSNIKPQWASVTYGTLVCLECSGIHRSLGVHLSFVRSVQMDSWTEKQIAAMEMSGGNAKLVEYFNSRKIPKNMDIATKYNTKQAEYYRNRLSRWLEGNKEPPPDPGNYDPVSGGDALGAEPLPGETTEEYNARQARLREAARERMRAKFGDGGLMGGVGSNGPMQPSAGGDMDLSSVGGAVRAVGGLVGGVGSFLKTNVLESETVQSGWAAARKSVADSDLIGAIKRNTVEEGSVVRQGLGGIANQVGDIWEKGGDYFGDQNGNSNAQRPNANGGKSSGPNFDDDFDDLFDHSSRKKTVDPPVPHAVSAPAMMRSNTPATGGSGMKLGGGSNTSAGEVKANRAEMPAAATNDVRSASKGTGSPASASPVSSGGANSAKKERQKLQTSEDFFAEFGM